MASVILPLAHRFRQLRKPRGEIGVAKGASGECDLATENENVPSLSKGLRYGERRSFAEGSQWWS